MIKKILLISGLGLTLMLSSNHLLAAKSGYYRWTDSEGKVHFSQQPPVGQRYEFVETQTGRRSISEDEPTAADGEAPEASPADNASMEVLPPKDPSICEQAKGNLQSLSTHGARIRATDADGKARYLTAEEIEQQRLRAEEAIRIHCN